MFGDAQHNLSRWIWDIVRNPFGLSGVVYDEVVRTPGGRTSTEIATSAVTPPAVTALNELGDSGVSLPNLPDLSGPVDTLNRLGDNARRTAEGLAQAVQWAAIAIIVIAIVVGLVLLFVAAAWIRRSIGDAKTLAAVISPLPAAA